MIKYLLLLCVCVFPYMHQTSAQVTMVNNHSGITQYGILSIEKRVMVFKLDRAKGNVVLYIRDENLEISAFHEEDLQPGILNFTYETDERNAYFLASWGSEWGFRKLLLKVDFLTGAVSRYAINSNLVFPLEMIPIKDGIVMKGAIEGGDFLEIFNYKTNTLYSITDFFGVGTQIWDMQVHEEQLDVLVHSSNKNRSQYLQILSFDKDANRTIRLPVYLPKVSECFIQNARLLYGPYDEYKIVGTYSFKPGEWFSGYFHIEINEFLEQTFTTYAYSDFEGFYDYKKRGKKKKRKNYNKELTLAGAVSDDGYITLASFSPKVDRKFIHFLTIDAAGNKVYDKSVKLYFNQGLYGDAFDLANMGGNVQFIYRGNENRNNPQGEKVFVLEKDQSSSEIKVLEKVVQNKDSSILRDPRFQFWYDNKFLVFGVIPSFQIHSSEPLFILDVIEVSE
ncbi:hypothetical protein [Mongoliibacter ruber]|uniref:Uncharacterized protein n=1 Tax=Mongoliibacter ruber TaxID=1750599 RepID=A0A2T0WFH3_9BACT|nr:hypothetical protein [Mongoliibacter ruber]PRY85274.1 hypothetical protein CLW00_11321 [Mongoliibacter ruber]